MRRKTVAMAIVFCMLAGIFPLNALAADGYSDVGWDHWAYESIAKWSLGEKPVLLGYDGGTVFGPDDPVKDLDLDIIISRILGTEEPVWSDSAYLTREQAVKKIAEAFNIAPRDESSIPESYRFADHYQIGPDYVGYVYAFKQRGIIQGMENNMFDPSGTYTRAQALAVLNRLVSAVIDSDADATRDIYPGIVVVRGSGVTLKNMRIDSDLIIGHGVGDGDVTLDNVRVSGRLIAYGGGSSSITLRGNSRASRVLSAKSQGQPLHIKVEGGASVGILEVLEFCRSIISGIIDSIELGGNASLEITVNSTVNNISVNGDSAAVIVNSGATVNNVVVSSNDVSVTGGGDVTAVQVTPSVSTQVVVTTPNTRVTNNSSAAVVDSGGDVVAGSGATGSTTTAGTGTTAGGGSTTTSDDDDSDDDDTGGTYYAVTGVTVSSYSVGAGRQTQLYATVLPSYASNRSVTLSGRDSSC